MKRILGCIVALLLLAGCGSGSDSTTAKEEGTATTATDGSGEPGTDSTGTDDAGSDSLPDPCVLTAEQVSEILGTTVPDGVSGGVGGGGCGYTADDGSGLGIAVFEPGPIDIQGEPVPELEGEAVWAGFAGLTWVGEDAKYVVQIQDGDLSDEEIRAASIEAMKLIAEQDG